MFNTYVVQPVYNLLVGIYALVPGYDLGVAIILFTLAVRLALWPLVRKQLHHARAMRKLQPELKKIKKAAKGDRQKEARLQMELYKEHEIRPFSSIGTLIIQIPIFIALYQSVLKLINDPSSIYTFTYSWVRNLPHIQEASTPRVALQPASQGYGASTSSALGQSSALSSTSIQPGVAPKSSVDQILASDAAPRQNHGVSYWWLAVALAVIGALLLGVRQLALAKNKP